MEGEPFLTAIRSALTEQRSFFSALTALQDQRVYYAVPATGGTIKELVNQSTEKPDGTGKFGATAFSPSNFDLDSSSLVFVVDAAGFAVPAAGTPLTEPDNDTKFFICETGYIDG